jgi:GTPase SAR1 family protein
MKCETKLIKCVCVVQMFCSCCNETPASRPEYSAICVGLDDAGKTTLLSLVCNEDAANVQPTSGICIYHSTNFG